jgi:uroporphyrin-III C-methyltransferase / precorrin-2 dehydrogenase / sirohydrochlorin ferrochelatase
MTSLLGLDFTGRLVLVCGGGPAAAHHTMALLSDGALVRVIAPQVCEDLIDLVAAGRIQWLARDFSDDDLAHAWLAVAASGDPDTDATVAAWAAARRVWCVHEGAGTATAVLPAVARHGDLTVGVIGAAPRDEAPAAHIRDQLLAHLQSGDVDLRPQLADGVGKVVLVGGGPGHPELITLAGRRALSQAHVVIADRLGPTALLGELPADVQVIDVGKAPGHHPVPQSEINRLLVEHARRGRVVVRLKGGDPFLLGRGGEEVQACQQAGVPVTVIPGVSSAVAVPAAAGIPITHRGTAAAFHVITGHNGLDATAALALRDHSATVVVLMGVAAVPALAASAIAAGADPGTPVACIEDGTLPSQRVLRTTLAHAADDAGRFGLRAPAVIVIGDVAGIDLAKGAAH